MDEQPIFYDSLQGQILLWSMPRNMNLIEVDDAKAVMDDANPEPKQLQDCLRSQNNI